MILEYLAAWEKERGRRRLAPHQGAAEMGEEVGLTSSHVASTGYS
jgi:hypothetical protein